AAGYLISVFFESECCRHVTLRRLDRQIPYPRRVNRSLTLLATTTGPAAGGARRRRFGFLELDLIPIDKHVSDLSVFRQNIAACDNKICNLADFNRPELIRRAKHFSSVYRESPQSFVLR